MVSFYVDTCIYLNLWKKEVETGTGIELWRIAKEFFNRHSDKTFYYSGFIIKEMSHKLAPSVFDQWRHESRRFDFRKLILNTKEFLEARTLEREWEYRLSFFDVIHLFLAKKSGAILVSRDKELLNYASRYGVEAKKPEEIL